MSTSRSKRFLRDIKWVVLALLMLYVTVPYCLFPSEKYYQSLIEHAKTVELQYLPAPNYTKHFTMATIPGSDTTSLKELSATINYRGVWGVFTDLSGNVYRIRVTSYDGSQEDVVVLGSNKVRYGNWTIAVSPNAVETIKYIVMKTGGRLPNKDIVMKILDEQVVEPNR